MVLDLFFSKLCAPFGYILYYGTIYSGVPKWDPDFGNYPFGLCSDSMRQCSRMFGLMPLQTTRPGLMSIPNAFP